MIGGKVENGKVILSESQGIKDTAGNGGPDLRGSRPQTFYHGNAADTGGLATFRRAAYNKGLLEEDVLWVQRVEGRSGGLGSSFIYGRVK